MVLMIRLLEVNDGVGMFQQVSKTILFQHEIVRPHGKHLQLSATGPERQSIAFCSVKQTKNFRVNLLKRE